MPATVVSSSTSNAVLAPIETGQKWSGTITINRVEPGKASEVTFFADNLPAGYTTNGNGLPNAIWSAVTDGISVIQRYASVAITITDDADANYFASNFRKTGASDTPGVASEPGNGPILAFDSSIWGNYSAQQQQRIVLHELGHILGLQHLSGSGPPNFTQFTVMSYNETGLDGGSVGSGVPLTPMALDVALLQAKYGAAAANTGETVYRLAGSGTDTDGSDGATQIGHAYMCIWDSGGSADTIEYAGSARSLLNLNAATLSTSVDPELQKILTALAQASDWTTLDAGTRNEITSASYHSGGFFSSILDGNDRSNGGYTIANGAVIEQAFGGNGQDFLIGNLAANLLWGRNGKDVAVDGGGKDTIFGGAGNDQVILVSDSDRDAIVGGDGGDTLTGHADGDDGDIIFGGETNQLEDAPAEAVDLVPLMRGLIDKAAEIDSKQPSDYAAAAADGADTITGGQGADSLAGGKGDDSIAGQVGDDLVAGDAGADSLTGEDGHDALFGGNGADSLSGGNGADLIVDFDGSNTLDGGDGADKFQVKLGGNTVVGGQGDDFIDVSQVTNPDEAVTLRIAGGSGHDWVHGLQEDLGPARMALRIEASGFSADDIDIVLDSSNREFVKMLGSETGAWTKFYKVDAYLKLGDVTVYVGKAIWEELNQYGDQQADEGLNFVIADIVVVTGSQETDLYEWVGDHRDEIASNGFVAAMDDGRDAFHEERGDATPGDDSVAGTSGDDVLYGARGNDQLVGGAGGDQLDGGSGDDVITGGSGEDVLRGGAGADVATFDGSVSDYSFSRDEGGALVIRHTASGEADRLFEVETLRFSVTGDVPAASLAAFDGTSGADTITGTAPGQSLKGFGGDDVLTPYGGGNTLNGGAGVDRVVYAGVPADYTFARQSDGSVTVTHPVGGGTDLLIDVEFAAFGGDPDDAVRLSALVGDFGTPDDDYLEGTGGADALYAGAGDDFVDGGGGNDTIDGGAGLDTVAFYGDRLDYVVATSGGEVEVTGLGDTAVLTGVEVLLFGDGTAEVVGAVDLAGTAGADSLAGGSASEIVSALAGNDTIDGGEGRDVLILAGGRSDYTLVREADGSVSALETATGDLKVLREIERVWFSGSKVLVDVDDLVGAYGTADDDNLDGVDGDERLFGLGGDDVFYGSSGADTLDGGTGFDAVTYYGASGDYVVTTNTDGSLSVVGPDGADRLQDVELVEFWGDDTALLPGASSGLFGTTGADLLNGTAGGDIISPLGGSDTVQAGGGEDFVVLAGGSGDYAFSRQADGTAVVVRVATNETLTLQDVERLWFEGTREIGDLDDYAPYGSPYDDWLTGTSADDALYGLGGDDWLEGGEGDDTLVGAAGDDDLSGDDGADRLIGGAGEDTYNGGGGDDVLVFDHIPGSLSGEVDEVLGFASGEDLLNVSLLDADSGAAGDQAFTWLGSASFSNVAGQLRFAASDWSVIVQGDVDGDGQADFAIEVWDVTSLQASDFLL